MHQTAQPLSADTQPCEQLIRNFLVKRSPEDDAVYTVPSQFQNIHKRACKTISAATMIVHLQSRGNSIISVPTQINVYFVWLSWMQAMREATLQPMHPKAMYADYFKSMTPEKIVVLLPVVCLWICVKCMEVWDLGSTDMLKIIHGVQQARRHSVQFTVQDVVNAEHVLLQLIDFDVLKNQEDIDKIEDMLCADANCKDMYVDANVQVVRSLYFIFSDVMDSAEESIVS